MDVEADVAGCRNRCEMGEFGERIWWWVWFGNAVVVAGVVWAYCCSGRCGLGAFLSWFVWIGNVVVVVGVVWSVAVMVCVLFASVVVVCVVWEGCCGGLCGWFAGHAFHQVGDMGSLLRLKGLKPQARCES